MKTEEKKSTEQEVKQPTYEELKNYCNQLLMQRNQIAERLDEVTNVINKMPWLFKVIENERAFSATFVDACAKEIEAIMTPPEQEQNTESTKEN